MNGFFSERASPTSRSSVLVCDDDIVELKKARDALYEAGYEVVSVLTFPNDRQVMQDGSLAGDHPWLSGYVRDFDKLVAAVKDPALAFGDPALPNSVAMVLSDGYMGEGNAAFKGSTRDKTGVALAKILEEEKIGVPMAIFTGALDIDRLMMQRQLDGVTTQIDIVPKGGVVKVALKLSEKMIEQGASGSGAELPKGSTDAAEYLGLVDEAPSREVGE